MKTRSFHFFLSCMLGVFISGSTFAAGDATSAKLKLYGVWLSMSGDCSSPVEVLNSSDGTTIDMLLSPTLAEKDIPVGTYKCLILKMNDVINFIPKTDDGHCVAGQVSTIDVCQAAHSSFSKDALTGDTITCTDGTTTGDKVFVYISVDSFCEDSNSAGCSDTFNAFAPPAAPGDKVNGIKLQNEIVVDGNTSGTFIFNLDGKIMDDGTRCDMEPPLMSYK